MEFNNTLLIVGPTCSGKSEIIHRLVRKCDSVLNKKAKEIIICHKGHQNQYLPLTKDKRVKLSNGWPKESKIEDPSVPTILVLDDLIGTLSFDKLNELVLVGAHHMNLFLVITCHSIFMEKMRCIRINSGYLLLMKNPADASSVRRLASQSPIRGIISAYEDATKKPYSYILIDNTQRCEDKRRIRTNVFLEDPKGVTVYVNGKDTDQA